MIANFMARLRKTVGKALEKCKPDPYSRPWMVAFLAEALRTADLPGAMTNHAVGWGDYVRARRDDPAFEIACQEIDLIIRHALLIQLESRAAQGDFKAAKLLAGGLTEIRRALAEQGVRTDGSNSRLARDRFPSAEIDGQLYPIGPCLDCISGLVVLIPWLSGEDHEVLIRHEDAESYEVPPPEGWATAKVIYGIAPDPGRLSVPGISSIEPIEPEGGD